MKSGRINFKNFEEFEYSLSDKQRISFNRIIDSGAVVKVNQLGLSKWAYLLKYEDQLLECEINYNLKSIKSFSCACSIKSSKVPCKHIQLLCYWHLSKIQKRTGSGFNNKSFDIANLAELDIFQLQTILNFLAKSNSNSKFWISLLIQIQSNEFCKEYCYHSVTDWALNSIQSLTSNKIQKEKNIFLLFQEIYSIALVQYKNGNIDYAIRALLYSILKIHKIIFENNLLNFGKLFSLLQKYYIALEEIIMQIKAPQAVRAYTNLLQKGIEEPHYSLLISSSNLSSILIHFNPSKANKAFVISSTLSKLKGETKIEQISLLLDFLIKLDLNRVRELLLKNNAQQYISPYNLVCYLNSNSNHLDSNLCITLYESIFDDLSNDLQLDVSKRLIPKATESGLEFSNLFLVKLYKVSGNVIFLKQLHLVSKSNIGLYETYTAFLLKALKVKELSYKVSADLCVVLKDEQKLMNLLLSSDQFEPIVSYEEYLSASSRLIIYNHYITISKSIQSNFVGQNAKRKLKIIGEHILSHHGSKKFKEYLNMLSMNSDKLQIEKI